MTTEKDNVPQSTPDQQPTPVAPKDRQTGQSLDRTQLWVAGIGAAGVIVAAVVAAVSAFAAGWLQYSGPGAAPQTAHTVTVTASSVASEPAPPPTVSAAAASPVQAAATLYLADQTGKTPFQDASPESGTWIVAGKTYAHSVGYPGLCVQGNVTFALNGPYKYFIATIGVADSADTSDRSKTVTFEVDDGSGNQLGSKAAQYGQPQVIEVPVQGITSLALKTNIDTGGCFKSTSVAIWGNARVVGS